MKLTGFLLCFIFGVLYLIDDYYWKKDIEKQLKKIKGENE